MVVPLQRSGSISPDELRAILRPAYFVPAGTPCSSSCSSSRTTASGRLVVDEYGELVGLVTIEDIIEEIIGDFTTQAPDGADSYRRGPDGSVVVDGLARCARSTAGWAPISRGWAKTLNGLIVAHLGEIPDAGTQVTVAGRRSKSSRLGPGGSRSSACWHPSGVPRAALQARMGRHHPPVSFMQLK